MFDEHNNRGITGVGNDQRATEEQDRRDREADLREQRHAKGAFHGEPPEKITAVEALDRAFAACMDVGKDTDSQLVTCAAHKCALHVWYLSRDMAVPPKLPFTAKHAAQLRGFHEREVERLRKLEIHLKTDEEIKTDYF